MTTAADHKCHEINATNQISRQLRLIQLIFAGAAAVAMFALFDAARPDTTQSVLGSGSVHLVDQSTDLPVPANGPFGPQFPQTPPSVIGSGGFAADSGDDQAQLQQQIAQQEMLQAEQQAEQQNEAAQQQAQLDEQLANNP
jgi:hypothetical protein